MGRNKVKLHLDLHESDMKKTVDLKCLSKE